MILVQFAKSEILLSFSVLIYRFEDYRCHDILDRIFHNEPGVHRNYFCVDMGKFDDLTDRVVTIEYGNAAILELPPIESNPSPGVTWSSSDGTELYGIKYATTDHNLYILDAAKSDEGSYRFVRSGSLFIDAVSAERYDP